MASSLPRRRAFLVQYSSEADPRSGNHSGRIEHVESGRSQRFGSLEELEKFVVEVLSEKSGDPNGSHDRASSS